MEHHEMISKMLGGSELCRILMENAMGGVMVFEAEEGTSGRILAANKEMAEMHGYELSELVGIHADDLHTPETRIQASASMQRIRLGDWSVGEHEHVRKDGSFFPVAYRAGMFHHEGKAYGLALAVDMSRLRHLAEETERYLHLLERTEQGVVVLDAEGPNRGQVLEASRTLAEMHGYSVEELLNMHISEIDAPHYADTLDERIERIFEHGRDSQEIEHIRKDGTEFPVEYNAYLIESGGRKRILSFIHDVSERKRLQEQLHSCEEKLKAMV